VNVATVQLGFPIFRFESAVHHHTPRKPVVFERMLLRLQERLAGNPIYNTLPLDRIFEDILRVADPDGLVQPSLERLITQGILRCRVAFQTLREVTLEDLQRTPLGDQMLRDGMLPATAVEDMAAHNYDPIGGRLLDGRAHRLLRREGPPLAISEEPFRGAYPADLIAAAVPRAGYPWWHESSRIDRVECRSAQTLWSTAQAALQLSDQGELSLELPDAERTAYIRGLDERTRAEQVILPILRGRPDRPDWEQLLPPLELAVVLPTAQGFLAVPDLMRQLNWTGGLRMLREVPGLLVAPETLPPRAVIVIFDDQDASPEGVIAWNGEQDGLLLRLPEPFPVTGCFYYDGKGSFSGFGLFDLRVGSTQLRTPLAYRRSPEATRDALHAALTRIEAALAASPALEGRLATMLWRPPDEVWQAIGGEVGSPTGSFRACLGRLGALRSRAIALTGNERCTGWHRAVTACLNTWISSKGSPLSPEQAREATSAVKACKLLDAKHAAALEQAVAEALRRALGDPPWAAADDGPPHSPESSKKGGE